MIPHYIVRHLAGRFEELSCFQQLEDESAALYFGKKPTFDEIVEEIGKWADRL